MESLADFGSVALFTINHATKTLYCIVTFGVRLKLKFPTARSKGLPDGVTTWVIDKSWIRPFGFLDSTVTVN